MLTIYVMNNILQTIVSKKLSQGLKESKLTQTQLASSLNKSRAYVSNIVNGRYTPKVNELLQIANYLNKPVAYFFGEDTPGLMHYVDKARKWDKISSMIETTLSSNLDDDIVGVPLTNPSNIKNITNLKEIAENIKETNQKYFLSKFYVNKYLNYFKPLEQLVATAINLSNYPEFGISKGDVIFFEPIKNNDIGDNSGKLFPVFYDGEIGFKRIYREGKEYYLEPLNIAPNIEKVKIDDPKLLIPGKIVFTIRHKLF